MRRLLCHMLLVIVCFLAFSSIAFAQSPDEEPILVIDPQGHSDMVKAVMVTPDGGTLVSVSRDKTVRLWDAETGDLRKTLRAQIGDGHEGKFYTGALSPKGRLLALGGYLSYKGNRQYGRILLFDIESGEQIGILSGHTDVVQSLAFSKDGRFLASASSDKTVKLWDMVEVEEGIDFYRNTRSYQGSEIISLEGHSQVIYGVDLSVDGTKVVSASWDGTVRLWELSKDHRQLLNSRVLDKHTDKVHCVAFAPNDKYIVSGGYDQRILLWDGQGKFMKEIDQTRRAVFTVAFSADSQKIVASGLMGDITATYSIPSGRKIVEFPHHTNTVLASTFFGDSWVVTGGGTTNEIYMWEATSGKVKTRIASRGKRLDAVAFGSNLQVAFGNTWGGFNGQGPLERWFDFWEMTLYRNPPAENLFQRTQTTYQGKTITKIDKWTLEVNGVRIQQDTDSDQGIRAYTFTPQGDIVVGSQWSLRMYRPDGTERQRFIGHTGEVWAVSVSQNGQLLASASGDQTLRLWNLNTGECLATLFVASDQEWICWTPKGYYTASAAGEKYIGWHINQGLDHAAEYYPVHVFRNRFHHPELVRQTITLGNFAQALEEVNAESRKRIEDVAIQEVLPPKVNWLSPTITSTETTQGSARIQATIQAKSALTEIKLLVNGRTQATERGLNLGIVGGESPLEKVIDTEVSLRPGKNTIAIFASTDDAGVTSEERIVLYQPGQKQEEWLKPNLYMVSIGISNYVDQNLQLTYADDDAKAMSRLFRSQEGKLYNKVSIKELYDSNATRFSILDALEWLEREATQKDVVVIFVASHGVNDQRGNFYLIPSDGDVEKLRQTGVDWNDFSETLGNLPSRVLLFIDTCHSGQLGKNLFTLRGQIDNTEAIRELASDENGVVIMAASTGKEFSRESEAWQHGAFTKALLDGLEAGKADQNTDGIIHLNELDYYISERVKELTKGEQHPTTVKPSTISRLPIIQVN